MICKATKFGVDNNFANALPDADWTRTNRSLADYVDHMVGANQDFDGLTGIPGWHTHNLFEDVVHADCLGVRQYACGPVLLILAERGIFGPLPTSGSWDARLDVALNKAWIQFNNYLKSQHQTCSQSRFRCLQLSMHKKSDFPCLKSKAKNCVLVSTWLLHVVQGLVSSAAVAVIPADHILKHIYSMLWGMVSFSDMMHSIRPRFKLTEIEIARIETYREAYLGSFYMLHVSFARNDRALFNPTFKFHQLDHLFRRAIRTGIAPFFFWTFSSEDAMGKFASLSSACHGATVNSVAVSKWLVYFWHYHFGEADA